MKLIKIKKFKFNILNLKNAEVLQDLIQIYKFNSSRYVLKNPDFF